MLFSGNKRIVDSGVLLTFCAPKTGNRFALIVSFVAVKDEHDRVVKGVKISTREPRPGDRIPFPEGAQLIGAMGEPFQPGDDYLLPKGSNSCSVTDTDGANYDLFKVDLVDDGEDESVAKRAGGVLYFHDERAIPPELGGEGVLRDNPNRFFEGG